MLRRGAKEAEFVDFYLPFGGRLRADNRWVKLARLMPWELAEKEYEPSMSEGAGRPGLSARGAVGALVIKERLGMTDAETVEQIRENPYLQFFLGFGGYQDSLPFDATMMVHFRRRLSLDAWTRLSEEIARCGSEPTPDKSDSDSGKDGDEPPPDPPEPPDGGGKPKNSGQLIVDATCTPCDVRRPSNLSMADEARRKTEAMIDGLYEAAGDAVAVKPRTYRRTARKRFSRVARQKKPRAAAVRQELWYQLNCLTRNLSHIDELAKVVPLAVLSPRLRRQLPTIRHFL